MGIFSRSRPSPPPPVPTDTVIPFHFMDGNTVMQAMVLEFSFRFDDVLEYHQLQSSLERLLEIGDWRKLGARIRMKKKDSFEFHVPQQYTEKRPGVYFSNVRHGMRISDHPIASQMPRSVSKPRIFGAPERFQAVIHGSDHPKTFDDWTTTDRPPLSVHVGSFQDATILSLTFSHAVLDAVGISELMTAWLCVLDGCEDKIRPFHGFTEDPLRKAVGLAPKEKHLFYDQIAGPLGFAAFILGVVLELVRYPQQETRTICIPDTYVRALKSEANADLASSAAATQDGNPPFVSDSDVLFAWWARLTVSCQNERPSRPVRLGNIFTFRGVIDDMLPPDAAYVGNAISCAYMTTTVQELLSRPLGQIALDLRDMLARQRNREQICASLTLLYEFVAKGKFLIFLPGNALRLTWSNWNKAKFFDMDFSSAVRPDSPLEPMERKNPVGRPTYMNYTGRMVGMRGSGPVLGRDAQGDWWFQWALRKSLWAKVEERIRQMGEMTV